MKFFLILAWYTEVAQQFRGLHCCILRFIMWHFSSERDRSELQAGQFSTHALLLQSLAVATCRMWLGDEARTVPTTDFLCPWNNILYTNMLFFNAVQWRFDRDMMLQYHYKWQMDILDFTCTNSKIHCYCVLFLNWKIVFDKVLNLAHLCL